MQVGNVVVHGYSGKTGKIIKVVRTSNSAGNKILVSKNLKIKEGKTQYRIQLEFIPNTLGVNIYKISVPLISGESIESNNLKEFRML